MNRSIRTILAGLVLMVASVLTGCGGTASAQSGTAEQFVQYFFDRVNAGDVDAVYAVQLPSMVKDLGEQETRKEAQSIVNRYNREGGVKNLNLTYSDAGSGIVKYSGTASTGNGKTIDLKGSVAKIDGKWYFR